MKTAGTLICFFKKQILVILNGQIQTEKLIFKSEKISDEEWNNYVDFLGYQSDSEKWRDHNTVNVKVQ